MTRSGWTARLTWFLGVLLAGLVVAGPAVAAVPAALPSEEPPHGARVAAADCRQGLAQRTDATRFAGRSGHHDASRSGILRSRRAGSTQLLATAAGPHPLAPSASATDASGSQMVHDRRPLLAALQAFLC